MKHKWRLAHFAGVQTFKWNRIEKNLPHAKCHKVGLVENADVDKVCKYIYITDMLGKHCVHKRSF